MRQSADCTRKIAFSSMWMEGRFPGSGAAFPRKHGFNGTILSGRLGHSVICQTVPERREEWKFSKEDLGSSIPPLQEIPVAKVLRIGCCDVRTAKSGVYFIGTVGAKVVKEVVADLGPLLGLMDELQLVGHQDCVASRARLGLSPTAELDAEQRRRVDEETERFLEQNAHELVGTSLIRLALDNGVRFRLGLDNNQGSITWKKYNRAIG